jgi:hypothetical protein
MTRMIFGAVLVLGLLGGSIRIASGDSALIQTSAPLANGSEEALEAAVVTAVEKAMIGARAMGFAWVALRGAQVQEGEVIVQILATDDDPDDVTQTDPETEQSEHRGARTGDRDVDHVPPGGIRL